MQGQKPALEPLERYRYCRRGDTGTELGVAEREKMRCRDWATEPSCTNTNYCMHGMEQPGLVNEPSRKADMPQISRQAPNCLSKLLYSCSASTSFSSIRCRILMGILLTASILAVQNEGPRPRQASCANQCRHGPCKETYTMA